MPCTVNHRGSAACALLCRKYRDSSRLLFAPTKVVRVLPPLPARVSTAPTVQVHITPSSATNSLARHPVSTRHSSSARSRSPVNVLRSRVLSVAWRSRIERGSRSFCATLGIERWRWDWGNLCPLQPTPQKEGRHCPVCCMDSTSVACSAQVQQLLPKVRRRD